MTFLNWKTNNNESVAKKSRRQIIGKSHENRWRLSYLSIFENYQWNYHVLQRFYHLACVVSKLQFESTWNFP